MSAGVFYGIGGAFPTSGGEGALYNASGRLSSAGYAVRALTYGTVGGVMQELQGGQFGHGFASAGVSAVFSPAIDDIGNPVVGTVASAVVGGTASSLAGGKFANGAVTGDFAYAFGRAMAGSSTEVRKSRASASLSSPDDPYVDLSPVIKADAALDVVRETCPAEFACDVPQGFTIKDLGGNSASTNVITGEVTFNVQNFDFTKDYNAASVLDSAYHESMHRGSGFFGRVIDGNAENTLGYITDRHQRIYDRSGQLTRENIQKYYDRLQSYRDIGKQMIPSGR